MSYAATAMARVDSDWSAYDVDLTDVEDLDGVVELVRSLAGDDADPALLLVEENDEWFAILRLDADDEPHVLISDLRVIGSSAIARLFAEAAVDIDDEDADADDEPVTPADDDETEEAAATDGEPAGDAGLLADLGTPARRMLELCVAEGLLPADVITTICESAGCLDAYEELRGA